MKKKIYLLMLTVIFTGSINAAMTKPDDEGKDIPKNKTGNQEFPAYDVSYIYHCSSKMLMLAFNSDISNVNVYVYWEGEPIISLEGLNKTNGSCEWINLNGFEDGAFTICITANGITINYIILEN